MSTRTTPITLEISQYRKFVKEHPGAQGFLTAPVFNEHGSRIDLVVFQGDKVSIYVDDIPEDRKTQLGIPDLRSALKAYQHPPKRGTLSVVFIIVVVLVGLGWALRTGMIRLPFLTPRPTPVPTPTSAIIPAATPTVPSNPTVTPVPTSTPISKPSEFRIRGVVIQDQNGAILQPLSGTYSIKPQENVTLKVESTDVAGRNIIFEYQAILGKIGSDAMYIAPAKPGSMDLVTVRAVDQTTGTILAQIVIKIKIIATK